uniref:Reverse transcriptase domain-containing protein n=1 Tax=Peronospora matthiolae TaxID=2874970 RepID=A0AAV1VF72_9STRA
MDDTLTAINSRVILLLDFRMAYDTVDMESLYEALTRFGFSERYVQLIRRLHTGTTATFLVNGEKSDPFSVVSGIRQGCPLAPLLFPIVVELLGIAIQQSPVLRGLPVPGGTGGLHTFSAFVDDSTIFLDKACQLDQALQIVSHFGSISGLVAQPAKSKLIFLNKGVRVQTFCGISVLQPVDTVRYLGYEVSTWAMKWVLATYNIVIGRFASGSINGDYSRPPRLLQA